jgi:hypothetical protein
MTMTTKELLAAAARLSQRSWTAIDADESVLARHILATVRADDDELIRETSGRRGIPDWLKQLGGVPANADGHKLHTGPSGDGKPPRPEYIRFDGESDTWICLGVEPVMCGEAETWPVVLHDPRSAVWVKNIATRGQLRDICRALGITLPEVPA